MATRILVVDEATAELIIAAMIVHRDNILDDAHESGLGDIAQGAPDGLDAEQRDSFNAYSADLRRIDGVINELDAKNTTYVHPIKALLDVFTPSDDTHDFDVINDRLAYGDALKCEPQWTDVPDEEQNDDATRRIAHWNVVARGNGVIGAVFPRNVNDGTGYVAIMGAGVICGAYQHRWQAANAVMLAFYG